MFLKMTFGNVSLLKLMILNAFMKTDLVVFDLNFKFFYYSRRTGVPN